MNQRETNKKTRFTTLLQNKSTNYLMKQNRNYQAVHIENIVDAVSSKRKVLAQLPTGGGKTQEFVSISQRYIYKTEKSVLILVHRKELMQQAKKRFKTVMNIDATLITSQTTRYQRAKVYIGMVESTVKRLDCFDNIGMVIIDECHMANFNKVHSIFLEELIIGFTATPISSSKKEPLNKFYNAIVCGPQIPELIELGFLAQNFTICPQDIVDTTLLEVDNRKGDFNENLMATAYSKPKYVINTVKYYRKYCKGQKAIIFNVNIEHSKLVCECFQHMGFNARHIDSEDDRNRDETLQWFKETKDAILCNVGIATTGYDEPSINWVILNFSTLSLPKFIQCAGRGSRVMDKDFIDYFQKDYPYKLEEKTHFGILDLGGNGIRFGDWNSERDWETLFNFPDIPGDGVAPSKTCPECEGLVHAAATRCTCTKQPVQFDEEGNPILCDHIFDRKKAKEEEDIGEMILITKGVDYEKLQEQHKNKYEFFTFEMMSEKVVREIFFENSTPSHVTLEKGFTYYWHLCKQWWAKYMSEKTSVKDISNSQWHIDKARHSYKFSVDKYKKKYEKYNGTNCYYCKQESVKRCDSCDFPVCGSHSAGNECINCATTYRTSNAEIANASN